MENDKDKFQFRYKKESFILVLMAILVLSFSGMEVGYSEYKDAKFESHNIQIWNDNIEEYNKLAKYYNTYPKVDFVKKVKDMWIIRDLYESIAISERDKVEKYPVYTTSLTIFITNDGKYLIDEKEVKLNGIESLFTQLSRRELSNIFLFDEPGDYDRFVVTYGRRVNMEIFPNDVYIHLYSQELTENLNPEVEKHLKEMDRLKPKGVKRVSHASENDELKHYIKEIHKVFQKYDIYIDY